MDTSFMSKESITNKINEAKEKTKIALSKKGISPEIKAAVESLIMVIDILIAIFLEKKTRKNASNSGLPPSRNNGPNGNRNKFAGDRKKLGEQIKNTRNIELKETTSPLECINCNENLTKTTVLKTEERKKIDIIYEVVTTTVTAEIKECPNCGMINKGPFPQDMTGPIQYGIGIKAMIINFSIVQMMSLERIQEYLKGLIGNFISQAIMLKYISQLSDALEEWEKRQIEKLLLLPAIHCDETSMRVDKVNYWIHSYSAKDITLQFIHANRGTEAIRDIGIIPRYGGILIHDSWASYLTYKHVDHGLCGSHLLRELKFVEDSTKQKWATKMKKLLQTASETVGDRSKRRTLNKLEYKTLQSKYRNILTRGLDELPTFPKKNSKRGRIKHTDAQNLWLRLSEHEESVLRFARSKDVDFTNNRSERDLRSSKLKQKVAGCFRTLEYAKHFCRISSYLKSMRYRGYSAFESICLLLQGNISD